MKKTFQCKHISDDLVVLLVSLQKDINACGLPKLISRVTGAPIKVAENAIIRADDKGLVDYGVSINYVWLTDEGKAKLRMLIEDIQ